MLRFIALHSADAKILWCKTTTPDIDGTKLVGHRLTDWSDTDEHREQLRTSLSRCIVYHEPVELTTFLNFGGQRVILKLATHCLTLQGVAAITTANVVPTSVLSLSERENECLALLAKGRTTKQIGRQLRISPSTVETHLSRAKVKLGVRTHDALLAYALDYLRD